jgi:hypothetical protein
MILVNVLCDEIAPNRQIIENAMLPCYTILDESLASVMWFGSRAKGIQIFAPGYQGLNLYVLMIFYYSTYISANLQTVLY